MNRTLNIKGMSCSHCARAIKKELEKITQVKSIEINLLKGKASIELGENVDDSILTGAVEEAGYTVSSIE
ncbi:heavy-metal-associated domain-containing protein [Spirochaetota bacterium]